MKVTRSREHLVNLGNYESVRVSASIEAEVSEQPTDKEIRWVDEMLDRLLERDLKEALANVPESHSSHLETWSPGE